MARKPPKGKSLAEVNPELANEWHESKNGDLTPNDVKAGSSKKVWWKCDKGDDHKWLDTPSHRMRGSNCKICNGRIIIDSNCLSTTHPKLAKEWHATKNGDLTPKNVFYNWSKKVWWKCPKGDDHEWETPIRTRSKGYGCPICSGHKVARSTSLANLKPEIAEQWHPTKNGELSPFNFSTGSGRKIWWKCNKGDDHEWQASIDKRVSGRNCPICSGHKTVLSTCLATTHPEMAKQWHPTKNGELSPLDLHKESAKRVWWKCDKGDDHEWQAAVSQRTRVNTRCAICTNKKVAKSNCLSITHPQLSKEWHPNKNGKLTPNNIIAGTHRKVWWKCDKGDDHEWQASLVHRSRSKSGCAVCSGHIAVKSNCLHTLYPKISKEWHPTKNGEMNTNNTTASSIVKVWWKCNKGDDHEWNTSVYHRTRNESNCPYCTLTPQSKQELTITFELIKFFKDINPKGFKTRVKGKLWSIDIYIPQLKLGIEFDGSYWHKDKRALDKLKTEKLEEDGFEIFRVREEPLKRIFEDDIMSKQPFNGKQLTNDILTQILSRYNLDAKKISKIEAYIDKKELQNEKGLDKYIDIILTEKAEKKAIK